jgi:hypothetical protein
MNFEACSQRRSQDLLDFPDIVPLLGNSQDKGARMGSSLDLARSAMDRGLLFPNMVLFHIALNLVRA